MASVICKHFSQFVDHCVTHAHFLTLLKHTHAKIIVSALECPMSSGDNNSRVVDHWCNVEYASKYGKQHYYACEVEYYKRCSVLGTRFTS